MPAGAGLVHVLAPLLAQVAPQRVLVGAQVDDPGRVGLDRRRRSPAGGAQSARRNAPSGSSGPSSSISGSIRRWRDATGRGRQVAPDVLRERRRARPRPSPGHRARGAHRRSPRASAGPPDEDLGADRRSGRRRRIRWADQPLTALTVAQPRAAGTSPGRTPRRTRPRPSGSVGGATWRPSATSRSARAAERRRP